MSQITIQCCLVSTSDTRQHLWELMANKNTPLINEMLLQVSQHPDFENWRRQGKLSTAEVKKICDALKTELRFAGQPSRFYISAIKAVDYTFKSWLKIQQKIQQKLSGKLRWKEMLLSDIELIEISGKSIDEIRAKAIELSAQIITSENQHKTERIDRLFELYQQTDDVLTRCAISYLLKNGCKVIDQEEDSTKFEISRLRLNIAIQRLTDQLENRLPKGRDLTGNRFLETLSIASTKDPKDNSEFSAWQSELLKRPRSEPFPITYETNTDMVWSKNDKGRICVHFNGLSAYKFEVYCDRRHLHHFQTFLKDQQTLRNHKSHHSSSLFVLRSGHLIWQTREGKCKGNPWDIHNLSLLCTIDTRLMSSAGSKIVQQEKQADTLKKINNFNAKESLTVNQESCAKRLNSMLERINSSFPRSSKPIFQGKSHILVGVSIGLEKPATIAIVDANTNKVLTYRSIRQLLGDNYRLLNRKRIEQQHDAHIRCKAQKLDRNLQTSNSELGQHVDRLIAKAIVDVARSFQAGSIVLPKLDNVREILKNEIQAKAEQKIPNYKEGQAKYTKQYRINIHKWSYSRLIDSIKSQSAQSNITIEEIRQPVRGSPQEQAKELALAAYRSRLKANL